MQSARPSCARRLGLALAVILAGAPAAALAGPPAGAWRRLPAAPIAAPDVRTSVWTGKEMLVFGRAHVTRLESANVAAAYSPVANRWRRLAPPRGDTGSYNGHYSAVWTGREMLVWGPLTQEAFNPVTNRWRPLPRPPTVASHAGGIVVWTGREMVGWGGGCCGDAFSDGAAYSPATDTWRKLARSPLTGGQSPSGVWTGRELIVFGVRKPDGPPLRSAAAYNPTTDTWRRIASLPAPRYGAGAVWDGREALAVGGYNPSALAAVGFAYDPATNRWRRLPPMGSGRTGAGTVWTGRRLLVWGGQTGRPGSLAVASRGIALDPNANRWSLLPLAPLRGRADPTAVWTGHTMIVWGGVTSNCRAGQQCHTKLFADGAALTPATS